MYETVIFDLDGTLLDTLDDLHSAVNAALSAYGLPLRSKAQVRAFVGNGIVKLMQRAIGDEDFAHFDGALAAFKTYYKVHCKDKTAPYAGIMSLLSALKARGIKTAVVSNKADFAVKLLAAEYRVITPDLPGHGYSGCPDMDYTTEDFSLFIEAFLKAMHIGEASIVACGQSAAYAIDYCSYNRDSVRSLVLISPGSLRMQDFGSARYLGGFFGKWIVRRYQNPVYMRKQIEKAFFDKTALQEQDVRTYCKPYTRTEVQECVQMTVANFEDNKVAGQLGALELPILHIVFRGGGTLYAGGNAAL